MMSNSDEIYAKMNRSAQVSHALNTTKPNTRGRIEFIRKNYLFEFGYSTDFFLANKNESIYTKVTTLSPLFIVANHTESTLLISQECSKE